MRPLTALRIGLPAALVVAALVTAAPATAGPTLSDVRSATVRFNSVGQAEKAGYADNALPCFDSPSGGMGEHLINGALVGDGGALDPLHPEALVYEVRAHSWKLVAVEYVVLYTDAPADGPAPTVLGQRLTHNDALGLWKLHAWLYEDNPAGMFTDYNVKVPSCP